MKVAIIGANGRIGRLVSEKLGNSTKYQPLAIIRSKSQVKWFQSRGIETKIGEIRDSIDELRNTLKGVDAIVFTAGSTGGENDTLTVELDGAVKIMEVAELENIKRFVMISAIEAENRDYWYDNYFRSYYIIKKYADRELMRTKLDWTIIRPGNFAGSSLGEATGGVTSDYSQNKYITCDDVADVVLSCLSHPNSIHKVFNVVNGDIPVDDFVKGL